METALFKGKTIHDNRWVEGFLVETNHKQTLITNKRVAIDEFNMIVNFVQVNPESICQNIGLKTKGREVYTNDVFFDEVENDRGDERHYFVVKWLQQKCSFVFMDYGDTVTNWDKFEEDIWNDYPIQVTQEELDGMHYAGNYFENPELLLKGDGEENE